MDVRRPIVIYISSDEEDSAESLSATSRGVGGGGSWDDSDSDDCVILEEDPFKAEEVVKEIASDDSCDDVVVCATKGQVVVACRDFPHPRHLCAKFPFATTSHEIHCDKCHCYICESLAPCLYWGKNRVMSHCDATDKIALWRTHREGKKNNIARGLSNLTLGHAKSELT